MTAPTIPTPNIDTRCADDRLEIDTGSTSRFPSAWFVAPTAAVPAATAVAVTGSVGIGALTTLLVVACIALAALMI